LRVDVRALLDRSRHGLSLPSCSGRRLSAPPAPHDVLVGLLVALARLPALGLAPGRDGRPSSRRLALTATQRVVDRVHRDPAHPGPAAAPAARARLPDDLELVVHVPHLPDRSEALLAD